MSDNSKTNVYFTSDTMPIDAESDTLSSTSLICPALLLVNTRQTDT